MRYIADLHIHSRYSRATSSQLVPTALWRWGQLKGIQVIATGDISHPQWLAELTETLQPAPAAPGLFALKTEHQAATLNQVPDACRQETLFILSGEISSIYKKEGQVRKIHNVVFLPSFEAAARFQQKLERIGNIRSDGRPILGLDARDLLELVLETDPEAHLVPAHIWTPWFSMLGSQSGFDSLHECFADLSPHIFAVETGLSSDPPMNWRLSMLDGLNLISNSDAHSPEKLGREANLFETDLSYSALFSALRQPQNPGFCGTVEFFPEEGKYHMDGHRKCQRMMRPPETRQQNGLCPVCGKPATLGVSYRVEELADRPEGFRPPGAKSFTSLVPLPEVIGQVYDLGPGSKKVQALYHHLLADLGPELAILMERPLDAIARSGGELTGEAIRRMRSGEVAADPGYDGEYGVIRLFTPDERQKWLQQSALFVVPAPKAAAAGPAAVKPKRGRPTAAQAASAPEAELPIPPPVQGGAEASATMTAKAAAPGSPAAASRSAVAESPAPWGLNPEQLAAVQHRGAPLIITAGPGTGKTRTLTCRLAALIKEELTAPEQMLAITFTNKAAAEMRDRLALLLPAESSARLPIRTFHAFGRELLGEAGPFFGRTPGFTIIDAENDAAFLPELQRRQGSRVSAAALQRISALKGLLYTTETIPEELLASLPADFLSFFRTYEQLLVERNGVDFDDLIALPVRLLRFDPEWRRQLQQRIRVIAVDEFQDINAAQYELFRIFAIDALDTCVIGDPDQAIYGFRGASSEFFSRMAVDLPTARQLRLRENYRSAPTIITAAAQMLHRGGAVPAESQLLPRVRADCKIQLHAAASERAEAVFVATQIEALMGGTSHFALDAGKASSQRGRPFTFGDFAILLRSRLIAPVLEEVLNQSGLPFQRISDPPQQDREALLAQAANFPELQNNAALLGVPRRHAAGSDGERIQILTLHSAKGLEFPVVFIIGCEENILPFAFAGGSDLEEERRLFYVGITRACERLYLTHARRRTIHGQLSEQLPSRFLADMAQPLLQRHAAPRRGRGRDQLSLF